MTVQEDLSRFVFARDPSSRFSIQAHGHEVATIRDLFERNRENVFYSQQLQVLLETRFSHATTATAVRDLAGTPDIIPIPIKIDPPQNMQEPVFYMYRGKRSWRADTRRAYKLQVKMGDPKVTSNLGSCAECFAREALIASGFSLVSKNVDEHNGRKHSRTNSNLDLMMQRSGIMYGIEIKNRWDHTRLGTKLQIAEDLELVPGLIVRTAPSTIIKAVKDRGGFVIELGSQIYPTYMRELADEVREQFGLPIVLDTDEALRQIMSRIKESVQQ